MDELVFFTIVGFALLAVSVLLFFLFFSGSNKQKIARQASGGNIPSVNASDIICVRRDEISGIWEVHIYGIVYRSLEQVPDSITRDQVVDAVRILTGFCGAYIQKPQGARGMQPEPSGGGAGRPERLRIPAVGPSLMPQINLAREIGDILDEMRPSAPALAKHSVYLGNALSGGVDFVVDGAVYQSVDEIPDAEVQTLIRAAIKEWERR